MSCNEYRAGMNQFLSCNTLPESFDALCEFLQDSENWHTWQELKAHVKDCNECRLWLKTEYGKLTALDRT